MIRFACEHCGRPIGVEARHAGKKGKCPKCQGVVTVPEKSTLLSFHCGTCGQKIEVPEVYAGKKGKCPKCKNAVVVPTGEEEPVGPDLDDIPPEVDEDYAEESPEPVGRPAGPDRRLIALGSAAAAVLVVGVVLFFVFRSLGMSSTDPRGQREVATTSPPSQPVTPAAFPAEPVEQEPPRADPAPLRTGAPRPAEEATRLQFRPAPGTRRRVQLDVVLAMSMTEGEQQHDMTNTRALEFDLEVAEPPGDGTVVVHVSLAAIRERTEMQGQTLGEYDSAEPHVPGNPLTDVYVCYLGNRFTVTVSPRGEIIDPGLDGLFLAAAERRVQAEDEASRERLQEKADQFIRRRDEQFGSRENRVSAIKKQLEEFPILGREQITGLLASLLVVLPDGPVRSGDTWEGSLSVSGGDQVQMAAKYTLAAVEQDICTIQAVAQRSLDEDPIVSDAGPAKVRSRLGGSSRATMQIERRTGWLLGREEKANLQGEVTTTMTAPQPQESSMQMSMEITSTLTTLR